MDATALERPDADAIAGIRMLSGDAGLARQALRGMADLLMGDIDLERFFGVEDDFRLLGIGALHASAA